MSVIHLDAGFVPFVSSNFTDGKFFSVFPAGIVSSLHHKDRTFSKIDSSFVKVDIFDPWPHGCVPKRTSDIDF